jgi:hypothetical protein
VVGKGIRIIIHQTLCIPRVEIFAFLGAFIFMFGFYTEENGLFQRNALCGSFVWHLGLDDREWNEAIK